MKDVIIGCINNYNPQDIMPWVNSINMSGFGGDKVVVSFGLPEETIMYLKDEGFIIYQSQLQPGEYIHNNRFLSIWQLLSNSSSYRYAILTDVRDVIFQYNPSTWLETNLNKPLLACSENILIKDESWNSRNLYINYPHLHDTFKNNSAYNVGTLAGHAEELADFCLNLYHFILTKQPGEMYADQAAFNCLVNMKHYQSIVQHVHMSDAWCCQLGITLDPKVAEAYRPYLLEPTPQIKNDTLVNSKGELFCLVHQYDRVPELNSIMLEKYK